MKWSESVWQEIQPVYKEILAHPFIKYLMDGTLSKDKFIFYIRQDALYLAEYSRVLAGIAARLGDRDHMNSFLHFASDSIAVENALHESFLAGIDTTQPFEMSPACMLYTSFLHKQQACASTEVALAAVLPCFWIYKEVGDYILENQKQVENPYQGWINTYGGEKFAASVEIAIDICDELAENLTQKTQAAMSEAFLLCSKMEWMFWDSAYRLEEWRV